MTAKENKVDYILEAIPEAAYIRDTGNSLINGNNLFLKLFKLQREKIPGQNIASIFDKTSTEMILSKTPELVDIGDKIVSDVIMKTADTRDLNIELTDSKIIHWDTGETVFLSILKDKTEERRLEKELHINTEKYNVLFEYLPVGLSITDDKGNLIELNKLGEQFLGLKKSEHFQRSYDGEEWKIIRPDGSEMPSDEYASTIAFKENRIVRNVDLGLVKPDEVTWLTVSAAPIPLRNHGVAISYIDITERVYFERKLEEWKNHFEKLYHNMNEGFYIIELIFDADNNPVDYFYRKTNPAFEKITGIQEKKIIDKPVTEVFAGHEEILRWIPVFGDIVLNNKSITVEEYVEIIHKNIEISAYPAGGNFVGVIINDISHRKRDELKLREEKSEAEEISRIKSVFLANMSHELRTPMNGILGLAQIMSRYADNDRLRSLTEKIIDSGKRLMNTLNSILDLSILENNKLDLNWENVELREFIQGITYRFNEAVETKNLKLILSLPENPVYIKTDRRLLGHIINNLLNNAVKFTSKGTITITLGTKPSNDDSKVFISIKDTGIGIKSEHLDVIFNAFKQVSEGQSRAYEGTGLGLTISKKMIELLQGSISLESELGKGTTFTLMFDCCGKLPSRYTAKKPEAKPEKEREYFDDKKILIVEDNATNIEVMQLFLEDICPSDCAVNPSEALSLIEKNRYSAILMDINLGMGNDGIKLTEEIRRKPEYGDIPIIAVTGYALSGDEETFLSSGLTHYIAKPFLEKDFIKLVRSVLT